MVGLIPVLGTDGVLSILAPHFARGGALVRLRGVLVVMAVARGVERLGLLRVGHTEGMCRWQSAFV